MDFVGTDSILAIGDNLCANLSAALKDSDDWSLVLAAHVEDAALVNILVHVASESADVRFVYFDFGCRVRRFSRKSETASQVGCGGAGTTRTQRTKTVVVRLGLGVCDGAPSEVDNEVRKQRDDDQ